MARRHTRSAQTKTAERKPTTTIGRQPTADARPSAATSPPSAERPSSLAAWLTVERVTWGLLIVVAASLRLIDLARFPLNDAEARLATAATDLLQGNPQMALSASPFAVGANAILFLIFGAKDASVRVLPALAGLVPVVMTYWLRDSLGRWGALLTASLFAFSSTFLYQSRIANGEIVALAAGYTAFVASTEFVRRRTAPSLYVLAGAAAIALTSGQATYTVLLVFVSFAVILFVLRLTNQMSVPELEEALSAIQKDSAMLRNALIIFALTFLVSATAATLNPLGLQGALNLPSGWLSQWSAAANQPASYYLQLFIAYELLPLIFGLAGLFYYLARGERFATFLAWWLGVALTWYTLAPFKSGSAMLVVLVPLMLISGRIIADVFDALARDFALATEGLFIILGLLACGILGINLSSYAQTTQATYLTALAIAVGLLVLIGVLSGGFIGAFRSAARSSEETIGNGDTIKESNVAWQHGIGHGFQVVGTVVFLGLSVLLVHSSINLSFNEADDPREIMIDAPMTMEVRDLQPMLEELSNRWEGDPHVAPVSAEINIGPALRWYLRDFRTVRYFNEIPATAIEPIVVVPAQGKQPGFVNYAAQKVRWRWLKPAVPLDGINFLRWFLYRGLHDVPPSYDIIVYVQKR